MLRGRNIIIFGEDWGRFPSTTQHIGRVLLEYNRLMWIGSLGHRKPRLNLKDLKRVFEKFRRVISKNNNEKNESPTPIRVNPFIIPLHDYSNLREYNSRSLLRELKSQIQKNNFTDPILITSSPLIGDVIGKLGESSSHYFCLDDYSNFDGAFNSMLNLERKLLDEVSCCFSVSDLLVKSRVPKTGNSYFLPQGVNTKHFKQNRYLIPGELKDLDKPVIGFFGLLSEWIDLELIVHCARSYPEYTFVVLGKPSVDISVFNSCSNIKFLGEIPFSKLPLYASAFDVGIIPFKVNNLTVACNPLKLLEYLSLGIPVVSTDLPEVRKFEKNVLIAINYDEFVKKIKSAVDDISEEKNKLRRQIAESFSWSSITEDISRKITEFESRKHRFINE